ncbi:hypothetical protein ACN38_g12352 [Penicillium nordicum]|uniref:Uncharacterized protein n=1 Tax=Penicillium nordicum TaxID=229535 RepID=A0A0M8NPR5_9EURO|nr:hypothetical protein ACN38_g12352 [Penicillium nordicum]
MAPTEVQDVRHCVTILSFDSAVIDRLSSFLSRVSRLWEKFAHDTTPQHLLSRLIDFFSSFLLTPYSRAKRPTPGDLVLGAWHGYLIFSLNSYTLLL